MVTGKTVGGLKLYPRAQLSRPRDRTPHVDENVTWFSNEEGKKGRIQAGQLADLIVPDRDYSAARRTRSRHRLGATMVGGRIVYGTGDFSHLSEAAPPPAMPNWSPVRRYGGYGAWADAKVSTAAQTRCSCLLRLRPPLRSTRPRPRPGLGPQRAGPDTQGLKDFWAHLGAHVGRCRHRPQRPWL